MQYQPNFAEYIDNLANAAIFHQTFSMQQAAEEELTNFVFQLTPAQFEQMVESGSDQVVLGFGSVLRKKIKQRKEHIQSIMPLVNETLMRWYQPNGTLMRRQGALKDMVEKTYGEFMGICLKLLFQKPENRDAINDFLDGLGGKPHYRLFLYFHFIDSFSTIDEDINYVEYRTLLASFQDTYIPRIFEALSPYFINISDAMDISELAILHDALSLSASEQPPECVLEFSQKNRFTELVFMLLENVVTFRYNLSYREYENYDDFDDVQISFPEALLVRVMQQNFLEALYSILLQLMRTNEFKFQQAGLNCLKKILLAKITYIAPDLQTRFLFRNMEGVLSLLRLVQGFKVAHRLNALNILECNYNFIRTFGFDNIEEKVQKEERYAVVFQQWLDVNRAIPVILLQIDPTPLDADNELFMVAAQTTFEIANELKINGVQYNKQLYLQYYRDLTNHFFHKFIVKGTNILGTTPFSFDQLKKCAKDLLGYIKIITTYSYHEAFVLLNNCLAHLAKGKEAQYCMGNFILFVNEMLSDPAYLDESIFGKGVMSTRGGQMEEVGGELVLLAEVLANLITFISNYQTSANHAFPYLNNAIILFICILLNRCSRCLTTGDEGNQMEPYINDQLYRRIKIHLRANDDENFLLNCLQSLQSFIHYPGISNIDFIFERLYYTITTIKSNMKREYFKKTTIYTEMLALFTTLSQQPMALEFMKWRALLFKIITTLSFDDALDQYRLSIRKTVELLKASAAQHEWVKILYDLTGIFQCMDGRAIFRYFLRYFLKQISFPTLLKQFFTLGFSRPKVYLRDVLRLTWMIIENHNSRIDTESGMRDLYGMLTCIVPYWNIFLESEFSNEEESQIEVYSALVKLIEGQHVNICLLDQIIPNQFRKFIKLIFQSMTKAIDDIESSGELSQSLFSLALLVTEMLPRQIFNIEDLEVGRSMHCLMQQLMRKVRSNFENMSTGAFEEKLLEPILKIIDFYFTFIRNNYKKEHLINMANNIRFVLADTNNKDLLLEALIKTAMEFRNTYSTPLQFIANIAVSLIEFYKILPRNIIQRLGLNDYKDSQELERIFKHIHEQIEDYVWLTLQMKDWLKVRSRFTTFTPNDY